MFDGKTIRIALIILPLLALSGKAAFGQITEATRIREERLEKEQRRDRGLKELNAKITAHSKTNSAAKAEEDRKKEVRKEEQFRLRLDRFRSAFTAFERATDELGVALGSNAKLKDPAREMRKSADVFLDFIKRTTRVSPIFDPAEFRNFTPMELGREARTSADRVTPNLAAVLRSQSEDTLDISFLMSLTELQDELARLHWMTQKLK